VYRSFFGWTIGPPAAGAFATSIAICLIPAASTFGQTPTFETLAAPGPLSEQAFGRADAPVTLIEYGNFTCHVCVDFNAKVLPALKSRYVDGGKLRFVFREIVWLKDPGGKLNAAAFMLARCAGDAKYFRVVDALSGQVDKWLYGQQEGYGSHAGRGMG
jgi:protein-disulfide isomerase